MLPSAVSDSRVHNILPNKIETDFQFSRASSATRVNHQGLIENVGYFSDELVQNGNFSELGSELVTNGDFATDSNWTKTNASISSGQATITVTGGAYSRVNQAVSYTSGKKYRLIANIKGASGSSGKEVRFMDNSSNIGGLTTSNGTITLNESVQTIELNWTANSNSGVIENARSTSSGDYSWDIYDISVKQVDPNDNWILGTGTTFGDNLVNITQSGGVLEQSGGVLTTGKKFKVQYTISNYVSGNIAVSNLTPTQYFSSNGVHSYEAVGAGGNFLYFANSFNG